MSPVAEPPGKKLPMSTTRKILSTVAAFGVALTLSAAPASATSKAGVQFNNDVVPINKALTLFSQQANGWTSSTSNATLGKDGDAATKALYAFGHDLTNQSWPANARSNVKTLYASLAPLIADLTHLSGMTAADVTTKWVKGVVRDAGTVASACNQVRHDLGLPENASA
jgi:hypothetical protein